MVRPSAVVVCQDCGTQVSRAGENAHKARCPRRQLARVSAFQCACLAGLLVAYEVQGAFRWDFDDPRGWVRAEAVLPRVVGFGALSAPPVAAGLMTFANPVRGVVLSKRIEVRGRMAFDGFAPTSWSFLDADRREWVMASGFRWPGSPATASPGETPGR